MFDPPVSVPMRSFCASLAAAGVLVLLAAATPSLTGCDSGQTFFCESDDEYAFTDTTPDGAALGATVGPTSCVIVDYEGRRFDDQEVFDSGTGVALAADGVVDGFRRGLVGRRVGESFRIVVPPDLGYGPRERPGIPACTTLEFDVTVRDTAPRSACGL